MCSQYLLSIKMILILFSTLIIGITCNTFQWNASFDGPQWQRSSQHNSAVCVDIPNNLTLCQGIGYKKMRLPNLLNHDSLNEVSQQSNSWVPLSKLNCHPDTKLFLCSLFSPVCLDHPIPPCRSLCESVQSQCEHVMLNYGYPWPEIVQCHQFPVDNDMCIQAQHMPPPPVQSLSEKKPIISNQHTENKHRKGNGHKCTSSVCSGKAAAGAQRGKKQRRFQSDVAEYSVPKESAVLESQQQSEYVVTPPFPSAPPSHHNSETRMIEEPQVDQVVDSNERPNRKWNKDQRQLYNDIIAHFCRSQWILKARLYPINKNKSELKVRNYRLIHGSIQAKQTPLVLSVNSSVIETIDRQTPDKSTPLDASAHHAMSRRRYFILGKTAPDGSTWVTYIMQWPHKSAQLRKAIKAITNGQYDCHSSDNSSRQTGDQSTVRSEHNIRRNNKKEKQRV